MSNMANNMNMSNYPNKENFSNMPMAKKHHPKYPMGKMDPCGPSVVCADPPVVHTTPAMYDPAQQWQKNYYENIIIPHVHASHTTHVKHTHFTHEHYYPHTESFVHTTSCSDVNCGPIPCPPCPPCPPAHHHHHPFGLM